MCTSSALNFSVQLHFTVVVNSFYKRRHLALYKFVVFVYLCFYLAYRASIFIEQVNSDIKPSSALWGASSACLSISNSATTKIQCKINPTEVKTNALH